MLLSEHGPLNCHLFRVYVLRQIPLSNYNDKRTARSPLHLISRQYSLSTVIYRHSTRHLLILRRLSLHEIKFLSSLHQQLERNINIPANNNYNLTLDCEFR